MNYLYIYIDKSSLPRNISKEQIKLFFQNGLEEALNSFVASPQKSINHNNENQVADSLRTVISDREKMAALIENSSIPLEYNLKEDIFIGLAFNLNLITENDENLEKPHNKTLQNYSKTELLHHNITECLGEITHRFRTNSVEKNMAYLILNKAAKLPENMEIHTVIANTIEVVEFKGDLQKNNLEGVLRNIRAYKMEIKYSRMKI